jgi:hypothetical protein
MPLPKFSTLQDDWQVEGDTFVSPELNLAEEDQWLVFAETVKDGSVSADLTAQAGGTGLAGDEKKDLSFVIRFNDQAHCYLAGIGGGAAKYYIVRVTPDGWQWLGTVGKSSSLRYGNTHSVRVEFTGSTITLFENDVAHLSVTDTTYASGKWGLRARKTAGEFAAVSRTATPPRCFVVMPFSSELSYVYRVIKELVEGNGMTCVRADEVFVAEPAIEEIRRQISQADLVIVDFTGRNPNVYYEAGLADAWNKR